MLKTCRGRRCKVTHYSALPTKRSHPLDPNRWWKSITSWVHILNEKQKIDLGFSLWNTQLPSPSSNLLQHHAYSVYVVEGRTQLQQNTNFFLPYHLSCPLVESGFVGTVCDWGNSFMPAWILPAAMKGGSRESQGWGNKRVQFQEPHNKMPKSSRASSGKCRWKNESLWF